MSLAELIPLVNNLSQSDKLSLFKLLAVQIPKAELQVNIAGDRLSVDSTKQLRPFGLCAGEFTVPDDFDAPLPEDILNAFEG